MRISGNASLRLLERRQIFKSLKSKLSSQFEETFLTYFN